MKIRGRSTTLRCAGTALFCFALSTPVPGSAQGKDDLWEVTSKMEMPGMPMAMPPQISRVCSSKNRKDEDLVPKQGDCRMLESGRTGNKFTYKMDCSGSHPSTVDGAITFGSNAYDGKMHMVMKGTNDAMDMSFTGKRVGDCTAATK
ncbi:MAG TPA: DUF3617 family protein [Actinomycetota bacterium]|nr:DUF3617 family protein [Actinomycetota bacterium]